MPKKDILNYKGFPLIRNGNVLYYGNITDKYIIMLQILGSKTVQDLDVSEKIAVQLQLTDPDVKTRDRIVKKTEKVGLYEALDVASIWLERSLAGK